MLHWLASIGRLGFIAGLFAFLRRRWKVAGVCLATAVLAEYLYAEYADYIQLLASMREVDGIVDRLSFTFVLKNVLVGGSIVTYVLFEVQLAKRGRIRVTANTSRNWLASAIRLGPAERRRATEPRPGPVSRSSASKGGPGSEQVRTPGAITNTLDVSDETSLMDDGFDFLRDGRKLRTRAEKLMHSE